MAPSGIRIRNLGLQAYQPIWQAMAQFTDKRNDNSVDELWVLEHEPVFTQGQAGKAEHILQRSSIPVVQSDRGGQVTYHGPGQLILYPLINLRRRGLGVRDMVTALEQLVIRWLSHHYQIPAYARADAPGVYIKQGANDVKIASLGLRVRRGCSFHGVSINITMDTSPFDLINPCGLQDMTMTQLSDWVHLGPDSESAPTRGLVSPLIRQQLIDCFCDYLAIDAIVYDNTPLEAQLDEEPRC